MLDLYAFIRELAYNAPPDAAIVSDAGSAFFSVPQEFDFAGRRWITSLSQAEMGYTIPACIGVAAEGVPVVGITGDGSFALNVQELSGYEDLDIKLFVLNNEGYASIRNTHQQYFGCDVPTAPMLDIEAQAQAYGIPYRCVSRLESVRSVFDHPGPVLAEVLIDPQQVVRRGVA